MNCRLFFAISLLTMSFAVGATTPQNCAQIELSQSESNIKFSVNCSAGDFDINYGGDVPKGTGASLVTYKFFVKKSGVAVFDGGRTIKVQNAMQLGRAISQEMVISPAGELALRDCGDAATCSNFRAVGISKIITEANSAAEVIKRSTGDQLELQPEPIVSTKATKPVANTVLGNLTSNSNSKIDKTQSIKDQNSEVNSLKAENESLKEQLLTSNQLIKSIELEIKAAGLKLANLTKLEAENLKFTFDTESAKLALAGLESDLGTLKKENLTLVENSTIKLKELADAHASVNSEKAILKSGLDEARLEVLRFKSEINSMENVLIKTRADAAEYQRETQDSIKAYKAELQIMQSAQLDSNNIAKKLELTAATDLQYRKDSEATQTRLKIEIGSLRFKLDNSEKSKSDAESKFTNETANYKTGLAKLVLENESLVTEKQKAIEALNQAHSIAKDAYDKSTSLAADLASSLKNLAEAQLEVRNLQGKVGKRK